MNTKFHIGQKVTVVADGEVGEVQSVHIQEAGVSYTISSKEVDINKKEIINGVKTCAEDELDAFVEEDTEKKDSGKGKNAK